MTMALWLTLTSLAVHATAMYISAPGMKVHARAPVPHMMAGFGAAKKSKSKAAGKAKAKAGLTVKQSWDIFRELRDKSNQAMTTSIYARLPDDGAKWLNVGGVIVEAPGTREQAVTMNKRLILEQ